jgi:hypothetical protein
MMEEIPLAKIGRYGLEGDVGVSREARVIAQARSLPLSMVKLGLD